MQSAAVMMQVWVIWAKDVVFPILVSYKQTWIVEFTIYIFTSMGPLLGWALG
jgi:hypothetical protein